MSEALQRAVQVLDELRTDVRGSSIRDLAARLGMAKSTVQRILVDLVEVDLAQRDAASRLYRLGPRTLALGTAYQRRLDVRAAALPHMVRLRDELDETVGLSVRAVDELLHIDQVESRSRLRAVLDVGIPLPLWSGAPSRVLLSALEDAEVLDLVSRREARHVEPARPLPPEEFVARVRRTRVDGYATAFEETLLHVATVSVPVWGPEGLVAALSITGPTARLGVEQMRDAITLMTSTAAAVSATLGRLEVPVP